MNKRRFPPPWTVEDLGTCFVVKDSGAKRFRMSITRKSLGGGHRSGCAHVMRRGGLRRTLRSCRSCCLRAKSCAIIAELTFAKSCLLGQRDRGRHDDCGRNNSPHLGPHQPTRVLFDYAFGQQMRSGFPRGTPWGCRPKEKFRGV